MRDINQAEKTLVFCATQAHALMVRDLINQVKTSRSPDYCHRVAADDGKVGDQHLSDFQDNEKTIPTILTTSRKLSTGVDARNVRNIVLMRPVGSMIEFKQIIGRGTRLYEGKEYFTIYDFVQAYKRFSDAAWDGEAVAVADINETTQTTDVQDKPEQVPAPDAGASVDMGQREPRPETITIRLADGKARRIQHMTSTSFWHPDGKPMSAAQFVESLFGELPQFFNDEDELRSIWSDPDTRKKLLDGLAEKGFGTDKMAAMQAVIDAPNSDLFDVLAHVAFAAQPHTRSERANGAKGYIANEFNLRQQAFLDFVLQHYVDVGVTELAVEKLMPLLKLKYNDSLPDALADLGDAGAIRQAFVGFQRHLYQSNFVRT